MVACAQHASPPMQARIEHVHLIVACPQAEAGSYRTEKFNPSELLVASSGLTACVRSPSRQLCNHRLVSNLTLIYRTPKGVHEESQFQL